MMLFIYFYQKISIFIHFQLLLLFSFTLYVFSSESFIVYTNKYKCFLYSSGILIHLPCLRLSPLSNIDVNDTVFMLFVPVIYLIFFFASLRTSLFYLEEQQRQQIQCNKMKCIAFQSFKQHWDMEILRVDLNILFILCVYWNIRDY